MNGSKILEKSNLSNEIQIDISKLPEGCYILIGSIDNKVIVKKIIKYGR
jgi:hypothetical protein